MILHISTSIVVHCSHDYLRSVQQLRSVHHDTYGTYIRTIHTVYMYVYVHVRTYICSTRVHWMTLASIIVAHHCVLMCCWFCLDFSALED